MFLSFLTALSHFDYTVPDHAHFPRQQFVEAQNPHYVCSLCCLASQPFQNAYLNTVAYVDYVIGKMYNKLLAEGLIDDSTLFWIIGASAMLVFVH